MFPNVTSPHMESITINTNAQTLTRWCIKMLRKDNFKLRRSEPLLKYPDHFCFFFNKHTYQPSHTLMEQKTQMKKFSDEAAAALDHWMAVNTGVVGEELWCRALFLIRCNSGENSHKVMQRDENRKEKLHWATKRKRKSHLSSKIISLLELLHPSSGSSSSHILLSSLHPLSPWNLSPAGDMSPVHGTMCSLQYSHDKMHWSKFCNITFRLFSLESSDCQCDDFRIMKPKIPMIIHRKLSWTCTILEIIEKKHFFFVLREKMPL